METFIPSPAPANRQLRILVVDDNPQVRQDLHQLLTLSGELEVVGEAGSGQEAVGQAGKDGFIEKGTPLTETLYTIQQIVKYDV